MFVFVIVSLDFQNFLFVYYTLVPSKFKSCSCYFTRSTNSNGHLSISMNTLEEISKAATTHHIKGKKKKKKKILSNLYFFHFLFFLLRARGEGNLKLGSLP
jgi:hypothetical protein